MYIGLAIESTIAVDIVHFIKIKLLYIFCSSYDDSFEKAYCLHCSS